MAALGSDHSIMRRLQSLTVSRIVCFLGIRWASSVQRGQISPIVQSIVVAARLGGITSAEQYKEKKVAGLKGDFYVLQQLQQTQNKTAKQHRDTVQALIMPFFEESIDSMVDHIKATLFNVNKPPRGGLWGPIVATDNPIMVGMMEQPPPTVNGVHPAPLPAIPGGRAARRAVRRAACGAGHCDARGARRAARRAHTSASCIVRRVVRRARTRRALRRSDTRSDTPRTHPPAMTPMYIHPAGIKQRLTLFETMADVKKNKTTCLGACTEQCQKDFHALLGEFRFIHYSFGSM